MSTLLNWCGGWAETFPYPPLADLARVDELLKHHDPQVAAHLSACGVGPELFAWPLLRSAFSEVLTRDQVWSASNQYL